MVSVREAGGKYAHRFEGMDEGEVTTYLVMAGQEVVYLRAILWGLGHEQVATTKVWEDNAACIQISKNPAS
eukprot:355390-Rhodomonas_salina.1